MTLLIAWQVQGKMCLQCVKIKMIYMRIVGSANLCSETRLACPDLTAHCSASRAVLCSAYALKVDLRFSFSPSMPRLLKSRPARPARPPAAFWLPPAAPPAALPPAAPPAAPAPLSRPSSSWRRPSAPEPAAAPAPCC